MSTSTSEFAVVPTRIPRHWVDKYRLEDKEVTMELLSMLKEYEEIDGYYLDDVVVNTDKIYAFRINHLLEMDPLAPYGAPITDGYLDVVYITSDFRFYEASISRRNDEDEFDWDVAQEIAKHLGLSMDEWKEKGRIEEIVGKMKHRKD
jgi:hypothetical protein